MTRIFKQRWFKEGYTWKTLTDAQLHFYYEELKKYFYWDANYSEAFIFDLWRKHAAIRYQDGVSSMRRDNLQDETVPDDVWSAWLAEWDNPSFKDRSKKSSQNRRSAPVGQDGPVKHTGGSRSAAKHKAILIKELGREPTMPELHVRLHTKKNDRTQFIDKNSKDINDRYEAQLALIEQSQQTGEADSSSSHPVDQNEIYMSLEGVHGYRTYGLGIASGFYQACSSRHRHADSSYTQMSEDQTSVDERIQA